MSTEDVTPSRSWRCAVSTSRTTRTARIIGFDTFTGFPNVSNADTVSPSAVTARFALPLAPPRSPRRRR